MNYKVLLLVMAFIIQTLTVRAEMQYENLLQGEPEGYIVGFENRTGNKLIVERIPEGETVEKWSHMVTSAISFGVTELLPKDAYNQHKDLWKSACKDSTEKLYFDETEKGYATAVWVMICQNSPFTGQVEFTIFKAIAGNDSFYQVQKAWNRIPSVDDFEHWMNYMRNVRVCDSRLSGEQSCPGH